mgnify:CR=1 FL=1|jgi:hypothetical protein
MTKQPTSVTTMQKIDDVIKGKEYKPTLEQLIKDEFKQKGKDTSLENIVNYWKNKLD